MISEDGLDGIVSDLVTLIFKRRKLNDFKVIINNIIYKVIDVLPHHIGR